MFYCSVRLQNANIHASMQHIRFVRGAHVTDLRTNALVSLDGRVRNQCKLAKIYDWKCFVSPSGEVMTRYVPLGRCAGYRPCGMSMFSANSSSAQSSPPQLALKFAWRTQHIITCFVMSVKAILRASLVRTLQDEGIGIYV